MTEAQTEVALPFRMGHLGKHTLIYGAGILLGKAVSFVMLPVYTRFLTPSDYGVLQLIQMTLEVISIAAGSRLAAGVFHFYHKAGSETERERVFSTGLAVLAGTYTAAAFLTAAAAPFIAGLVFHNPEGREVLIRIAAASLAFEGLLIMPLAYLQVRQHSRLFVAANAARLLLQLGMNILLVVAWRMGAHGALISVLVANVVIGTSLAVHLVGQVGLRWSGQAARDLVRFGLPFVGTQVATFVLTFGDRYFIQKAADPTAVGLYGLAYQFGFLLATVGYLPFFTVWDPVRFEIARRPDRDQVYARVFLYFNLVLITTAVLIGMYVDPVLRIMAAPAFRVAGDIVPIILLAYVFQSWTQFVNLGILIKERTGHVTVANFVGAGVAIVAYLLLIPRWLGLGAAVATVTAFAVRHAMIYYTSQRLWPVAYRWGPVIRLMVIAAAVCVAEALLPSFGGGLGVVARTLLLVGYLAAAWRLGILTAADRDAIRAVVRSPRAAWKAFRRSLESPPSVSPPRDEEAPVEQGSLPRPELEALLSEMARGTWWFLALERLQLPTLSGKRYWFTDLEKAKFYSNLPVPSRRSALDVGAGSGVIAAGLAGSFQRVVALEHDAAWCEFMRRRFAQDGLTSVEVKHASAVPLPFGPDSLDLVVVNGVLEWIPEAATNGSPRDVQLAFLRDVRRALRPGGMVGIAIENRLFFRCFLGYSPHGEPRFAAVLPRPFAEWLTRRRQQRPYRNWIYGPWGYRRLLAEAGFGDIRISLALPSYHTPRETADLRDGRAALRHYQSRRFGPNALLTAAGRLGLLGYLTHSFYIAARK